MITSILLSYAIATASLAPSPLPQDQTLLPVADAMVAQANPTTNYGTSTTLRVRRDTGVTCNSFLRFVVPAGTPAGPAVLRLFCTDESPNGGMLYLTTDNGWKEGTLSWNNQPKLGKAIAPLGAVASNAWVELDVSAAVTGPGTYVLSLAAGSSNSAYYSSREGAHAPQLVLSAGGGGGPTAAFSGSPLSGSTPLQVAFDDLSSGSPTSWSWSFGDGTTSNQAEPAHTYTAPGDYDVTLTVSGPGGTSTHFADDFVHVSAPGAFGLWSSKQELAQLPMSGSAWNSLLAEANKATGTPKVSDQNDNTDVRVLAKALVFARTGNESYRTQVVAACAAAIGTEVGGQTLALGRNLAPYVIAADLVKLPPATDTLFRAWLAHCLTENLGGRTLQSTHEDRPNNWGTHAGASRAAVAVYLGDSEELERCAQVFKGWLGDRDSYAGFEYGELDWQADPSKPVGINPLGSTKQGHSIDGVLPDDQRRSGGFTWPPPKENYVWEALQGALLQASILSRAGYDAWNWEDQAILRAVRWLHDECAFPATGDDTWQPHVINKVYGTDFPAPIPSSPGKNVGWTDWTHASS